MISLFEIKTETFDFLTSIYVRNTISFLSKAAAITKKIYGNNSKEYARIIGKIGTLNNTSQHYSQAIPFLHLCLDIYEDLEKTNEKFYTDCLINLGIAYSEILDYDNAIKYLYKALELERLRFGIFSDTYQRCLNYVINIYETYKNKREGYSRKQSKHRSNSDFSAIDNELSKLYIDSCQISKRNYGLAHPNFLENVVKLKGVSSFNIVEPYYREISEFLHKNDDFKSGKFDESSLMYIDVLFKDNPDLKKIDKDIAEQMDKDLAALNSVSGDMLGAMGSGDDIVSKNREDIKDYSLAKYDELLESSQEPGIKEPKLINGLADDIYDNDFKSQIKCSLFSVHEASPGDDILIQVFTHGLEKSEEAIKLAKEFDMDASLRQSKTFDNYVKKDATLTFELEIKDIPIEDPIQHLKWKGVTDSVQFMVSVPDTYSKQGLIGKVRVALDNIPIGHFCFKINISVQAGQKKEIDQSNFFPMKNYRYAFISYASKDRAEVLRRVQMLDLLKIRYFQDILSLNPGDRWGKEILNQIDLADVFFLFWSSAARDSEWVMKEVEYAINKKNSNDDNPPEIYPVILESSPVIEPPESLKHLHFNDKIVYFI
jgi:tetratricopeptide (TPR) repeat protein